MAEELAKTTPTQLPKSTTDPDSPKKEPPLAVSTPPQTLTISIPYPPSSIFSPTGNGQLTFSQLLADAMAASGSPSPLGNSPGPLQISPVQMVAAPCFVNPTGVIESPHQLTGSLGMTHQAALASVTAQAQKQLQKGHHLPSHTTTIGNMYSQSSVSSLQRLSGSIEGTIITPKADQLPISEIKSLSIQTVVKTTSSDGYNWRKYGQKQVKASEISRSYYRCTHVNCSAKKKIEHYHDGRVIEVVYLGEHGHEPTPVKIKWSREKESLGSQSISPLKDDKALEMIEKEKSNHYPVKNEQDPDLQIAELKKSEHSQAKSYEDPGHEKPEKLHHSSSDHEMDGKNKPDKNDEGPDPKRSKLCEVPVAYEPSLFKTVREGKVVVKNSFDEVPAGDGYRWRKYGQKIVKGSLSPRSYYKCTHLGCPVRKHVERAEDVKAVITTYEGHHNHDIPPLRSNSDVSSPRASILPKQSSTPLEKNPSKSKLVSNKMITDEKASEPGDKSLESDKTTADVELDLSSEGKAEVILPKSSQGLCLTVKVQQQFQSRTHEC